MKRHLSEDEQEAAGEFNTIAGDLHPKISHLIEVFERDGLDVETRVPGNAIGELWAIDEDGMSEVCDWIYTIIDTVGFDSYELARMPNTELDDNHPATPGVEDTCEVCGFAVGAHGGHDTTASLDEVRNWLERAAWEDRTERLNR